MKKVVSEKELYDIVYESVNRCLKAINENQTEEGMWDRVKAGANTFMNNRQQKGFADSWRSAKANYQNQGRMDELNDLIQKLSQLIDQRKISPDTTIAQLIGGKYNQGKRGTLTGMANYQKMNMRKNGYTGDFKN